MSHIDIQRLTPGVILFVKVALVLGPIAIAALVIFIKSIENKDPQKIRWR